MIEADPESSRRLLQQRFLARQEHFADIGHWLLLGAVFVFLVVLERHHWFIGDEWDPIVTRTLFGSGQSSLFWPHNEHWTLVPIALYRVLFAVFGVRTYLPYALLVIGCHLFVVQLLWMLLRRLGINVWVALASVASFALLGAGWFNIIYPFQIAFDIPVAVGLATLLIVPQAGRWSRRDTIASGLLIIGIASSSIGLVFVGVVGLVQLLRRGVRVAVGTILPATIIWLVWYSRYGRYVPTPGKEPFRTAIQQIPAYVWNGLNQPVSVTTGLAGTGAVAIVLLTVWAVRHAQPFTEPWPVALSMAAAAPLLLTLTGLGRVQFGADYASTSRYAYIVLALLLPLAALAVDFVLQRARIGTVILVAGTGLLLLVGTSLIKQNADREAQKQQQQHSQILAAAHLARTTTQFLSQFTAPIGIGYPTVAQIHQLDVNGDLPVRSVTQSETLSALVDLQLVVGQDLRLGQRTPATLINEVGGVGAFQPGSQCVRFEAQSDQPSIRLHTTSAETLTIAPQYSGNLLVQLKQGSTAGATRSFPLEGAHTTHINLNVPGVDAILTLPPTGSTEICGVQPSA